MLLYEKWKNQLRNRKIVNKECKIFIIYMNRTLEIKIKDYDGLRLKNYFFQFFSDYLIRCSWKMILKTKKVKIIGIAIQKSEKK